MSFTKFFNKFELITLIIYNNKYIWFNINIITNYCLYILIIFDYYIEKILIIYNTF